MCFKKPRRPISHEAPSTRSKRTQTTREWYKDNPPDERGLYYCYLNIAVDCKVRLTRSQVRLEHVKSKARHPELKYDKNNIKPACDPCNGLKASKDIEDLVEEFPHLKVYL